MSTAVKASQPEPESTQIDRVTVFVTGDTCTVAHSNHWLEVRAEVLDADEEVDVAEFSSVESGRSDEPCNSFASSPMSEADRLCLRPSYRR
jgi:hypothetical protein